MSKFILVIFYVFISSIISVGFEIYESISNEIKLTGIVLTVYEISFSLLNSLTSLCLNHSFWSFYKVIFF